MRAIVDDDVLTGEVVLGQDSVFSMSVMRAVPIMVV